MAAKRILITGVGGIVGSSIYMHLSRFPARYELYGLGRRRALSERVQDGRQLDLPESRFTVCDLADYASLCQAMSGMDVVVHMAAYPGGNDWQSLLQANIIGARNVFEACVETGVKRIVAASTIQVSTGNLQMHPVYRDIAAGKLTAVPDDFAKLSPTVPAEPRNLYAASKVFNESLCRVYAARSELSCLAIRIGWVVSEDRPRNNRADIWCSQSDIARLVECCIEAGPEVSFDIFYGVSESRYRWVDLEGARQRVGYVPSDHAEDRV